MSESFVNPIFGDHERVLPATPVEFSSEVDPEIDPEIDPGVNGDVAGTGNAEVDRVVASLGALDEIAIEDHVAVFEQAHESLRRTLAGAGAGSPMAGHQQVQGSKLPGNPASGRRG